MFSLHRLLRLYEKQKAFVDLWTMIQAMIWLDQVEKHTKTQSYSRILVSDLIIWKCRMYREYEKIIYIFLWFDVQ